MSRWIDADALEKIIRKRVYAIEVEDILAEIANAPSIDIVRCKECIDNSINCDGDENWCLRFGYDVDPSDFCSYGERREP